MSVPKTVTRVSKDGNVKFTSNVNVVEYTLNELIRGALRDVGRFVAKQFRISFYSHFKKINGAVSRGAGFKVFAKDPHLQVGIAKSWKGKVIGESGIPQELGDMETGQEKLGLLRHAVMDNIPKIIEIESKYLSELNKDNPSINTVSDKEYEE